MARMLLDGADVAMPPEIAASMPTAAFTPVPMTVTNFQARTALRHAGLFETAAATVDAMAKQMHVNGDKIGAETLREAWERASFQRSSPMMAGIAKTLALTDAQLDELFRAASAIEV